VGEEFAAGCDATGVAPLCSSGGANAGTTELIADTLMDITSICVIGRLPQPVQEYLDELIVIFPGRALPQDAIALTEAGK
jgi:hypothetical protein